MQGEEYMKEMDIRQNNAQMEEVYKNLQKFKKFKERKPILIDRCDLANLLFKTEMELSGCNTFHSMLFTNLIQKFFKCHPKSFSFNFMLSPLYLLTKYSRKFHSIFPIIFFEVLI